MQNAIKAAGSFIIGGFAFIIIIAFGIGVINQMTKSSDSPLVKQVGDNMTLGLTNLNDMSEIADILEIAAVILIIIFGIAAYFKPWESMG